MLFGLELLSADGLRLMESERSDGGCEGQSSDSVSIHRSILAGYPGDTFVEGDILWWCCALVANG